MALFTLFLSDYAKLHVLCAFSVMFNVRKMEIYLLSVCSFVLFVVLGGFRYTYFFLYSTWVECRFFQFGMDLVIHLSLFVINIVVHLSLNINH